MTDGAADAVARLSAALADRYRIERELGAGGMATPARRPLQRLAATSALPAHLPPTVYPASMSDMT